MREFKEIYEIAAERKGGAEQLEALLSKPKSESELKALENDRWLSVMAQCIFNAGFNWKVVKAKWPGFEEAFYEFDLGKIAMFDDDDLARLVSDTRIVRHGTKIRSVQENAIFLLSKVKEHGSVGEWIGNWPNDNYIGLLEVLKKQGSRLGGNTGQYFLRFVGYDGFILSRDVVARLTVEGVVDKPPTSKAARLNVQQAFNNWKEQSGRSLQEISGVLARSIG